MQYFNVPDEFAEDVLAITASGKGNPHSTKSAPVSAMHSNATSPRADDVVPKVLPFNWAAMVMPPPAWVGRISACDTSFAMKLSSPRVKNSQASFGPIGSQLVFDVTGVDLTPMVPSESEWYLVSTLIPSELVSLSALLWKVCWPATTQP